MSDCTCLQLHSALIFQQQLQQQFKQLVKLFEFIGQLRLQQQLKQFIELFEFIRQLLVKLIRQQLTPA